MKERRWLRIAKNARQIYFPVDRVDALKKVWALAGVMLAVMLFLTWLFQFRTQTIIVIGVMALLEAPVLNAMYRKKESYQKRFHSLTGYMEQMLYNFRTHKKVLVALEQTLEVTPKGHMHEMIAQMRRELLYGDSKGTREVLEILEHCYPGRRLSRMHEFFCKVESLGGECELYIDLLLEDLRLYEQREKLHETAMKSRMVNVFFSVIISIVICLFVEKIIPDDTAMVSHLLYQISGIGMFVLDLICLLLAAKMMMSDPLSKEVVSEREAKVLYDRVSGYSYRKEWKRQKKALVIVAAFIAAGIYSQSILLPGAAIAFFLVLLIKPKLSNRLRKKKLLSIIQSEYSIWLMEVGMLLQETTVQEAIRRSQANASVVLKPHINRLVQELADNPVSHLPYQNFMKEYQLSQVASSMKMLCAISGGGGNDVKEQVQALIHLNIMALDTLEQTKNENRQGGMYALFLLPQIAVGVKLIPDMLLFLLLFLRTTQF
ncbi:MAG: hypothetical protein K6G01_05435 [Eubacterium sp.]|nr:hypothetical protein [Eubacterium sp.]